MSIPSISENKSPKIKFQHTQQQLSDFFGVTRPSFARELNNLEKDGIIKIKNKEVEILDYRKLKKLLV